MKRIVFLFVLASLVGWGMDARAMHCQHADAEASSTGCISTSLFFTIDLDALDVSIDPHGSATLGSLGEFILPITGGDGPPMGTFEHAGASLEFEFDSVDVELEDIEFDFDAGLVNGQLSAGPIDVSTGVFDLVVCNGANCVGPNGTSPSTGYGLFLRPTAADFFENVVFDDSGFDDGDQIAWAENECEPVPEPMLLTLLGFGLAVVGAARRSSV